MRDNSVLSNREYDQLLKDLKANAFKQCDDAVSYTHLTLPTKA